MTAIGGAIGTGLFLGAGGRLASAGAGLFLADAPCGVFVFLILRALGRDHRGGRPGRVPDGPAVVAERPERDQE